MAVNTKKINLHVCVLAVSRSYGNIIAEAPINWVSSARYQGSFVRFKC